MLIAMVHDSVGVDLSGPWHRARAAAGIKHEALAALMGYSTHTILSEAVAGKRHLSFQRLLRLLTDADGKRFLRLFVREAVLAGEDDPEVAWQLTELHWLLLKYVDSMQTRMAKAQLRAAAQKNEVA